jgi:N-acetylmuramoyl-L-alanine amidase
VKDRYGTIKSIAALSLVFDNRRPTPNDLKMRMVYLIAALLLCACGQVRLTSAAHENIPVPPVETPNPWFWLERYQRTITRADFEKNLQTLFDPFGGLQPFLVITDDAVTIYPNKEHRDPPQFRLEFARQPGESRPWTPPFRTPEKFRALPKNPMKPLEGLRIALDPGHIGGKWGPVENRSTLYRGLGRIQEGDLNIITAGLLRSRLMALGADVFLTREGSEPTTALRPEDFYDEAAALILAQSPRLQRRYGQMPRDQQISKLGAPLQELAGPGLWKRDEIIERGFGIRRHFEPDLTLVLYINATPRSGAARLTPGNRLIFFVHGCYTKSELLDAHARLRLFYKLLDQSSPVEVEVARAIAETFRTNTKLPAVLYQDSATTRSVIPDNPYVVARNLAANREYNGPVVTTEPFFMNNRLMAQRFLTGDYEGLKSIDGRDYRSVFREYADWVVEGILKAYAPDFRPAVSPPALSVTSE